MKRDQPARTGAPFLRPWRSPTGFARVSRGWPDACGNVGPPSGHLPAKCARIRPLPAPGREFACQSAMTNGVSCLRVSLKLTMVEHTTFSVLCSCPGMVLATRGWPCRSRNPPDHQGHGRRRLVSHPALSPATRSMSHLTGTSRGAVRAADVRPHRPALRFAQPADDLRPGRALAARGDPPGATCSGSAGRSTWVPEPATWHSRPRTRCRWREAWPRTSLPR